MQQLYRDPTIKPLAPPPALTLVTTPRRAPRPIDFARRPAFVTAPRLAMQDRDDRNDDGIQPDDYRFALCPMTLGEKASVAACIAVGTLFAFIFAQAAVVGALALIAWVRS